MWLANNSAERTLAKAANGDQGAFAELVRQHQSMVFSLAWHFVRDRETAEDLAQDVFLLLHRSLRTIESPPHLVQWLRKVTSHRAIDHTRRARYRPRVGLDGVPEPRQAVAMPDPLLEATLERLIAELPDRPRMIVILRYQEDLDPSEIAEVLDIPVGTVKSSLHRALAVLRGRMQRQQRGVA